MPDYRAFCPMCGVGVAFDEDGCCQECGTTTCSMNELRVRLRTVGLHIVGELDTAVLDACAALPGDDLRQASTEGEYPTGVALAKAELARREASRS